MRLRGVLRRGAQPRGPTTAYLGLGSNVGDRLATLRAVRDALDAHEQVNVEATSTIYETAPVGGVEQPQYLNMVLRVATTLSPRDLLRLGHRLEAEHGRDRASEVRWGPRTLDIDLLLYGDETIDDPGLVVPHPRLTERAFVLVPLAEVMPPGATLPDGSSVTRRLAALAPIEGIDLYVRLDEQFGAS